MGLCLLSTCELSFQATKDFFKTLLKVSKDMTKKTTTTATTTQRCVARQNRAFNICADGCMGFWHNV